ncbi:hypothetical protein TNCV_3678671 [Trichonephila clavipes]|nr:hypothetical protein TNCV_3678671 [Trichonephila clavipes]
MNDTIHEIKRKEHKPQEIPSEQDTPDEDMIEFSKVAKPRPDVDRSVAEFLNPGLSRTGLLKYDESASS